MAAQPPPDGPTRGCNMCEGQASEMCAREGGNVRHGEGEGSRCVISVGGTTGQRRLGMADGLSVGLRVVGVCVGGCNMCEGTVRLARCVRGGRKCSSR